jgi:MFS superfamily sulfate permease-like transporter
MIVNWIERCLRLDFVPFMTTSFVVVFFNPTKGIRWGCPLSPFLFLLVVEGISRFFIHSRSTCGLKGIKLGRH